LKKGDPQIGQIGRFQNKEILLSENLPNLPNLRINIS